MAIRRQSTRRRPGKAKRGASLPELELPTIMDKRFAQKFKNLLIDIDALQSDCVINARKVEKLSTSCLQVLLSYLKTARRAGRKVRIDEASVCFRETAILFGLEREINDELKG